MSRTGAVNWYRVIFQFFRIALDGAIRGEVLSGSRRFMASLCTGSHADNGAPGERPRHAPFRRGSDDPLPGVGGAGSARSTTGSG